MEQKVAVPAVPLLKTIRKEEFAELADAIRFMMTQDASKRWLDYMGREVSALIQILTVKVLDDIKDINYIRGIIMGLNLVTFWP